MLHIPMTGNPSDSIRGNLYRLLYFSDKQYTKQALARDCGISMPTLYQTVSELMESGLAEYSGEEQFTGGRRAKELCITPDARVAVGMSVTREHLRFSAIDLRLNEIAGRKVDFSYFEMTSDSAKQTAALLENFLDENGIDRERLLGVGISMPGIISADCSRIVLAPTLHFRDQPLGDLTDAIPYPVYVANDATCSGYAEGFTRRDKADMAYLSLEGGVGGCILSGGVPLEGANRRSAEFGHICVQPGGLACSCGRHGCLEAYCTARRIREETGVSLEEFFDGVSRHVPEYETLWYDMLRHLAAGINTIRMVLDCDVVLGGYLTDYMSPYMDTLRKYVLAGNPFDTDADFLQLSVLRRHIAPIGAALYFVREFIYTM